MNNEAITTSSQKAPTVLPTTIAQKQVIELDALSTLVGFVVLLIGAGIAWGKLKESVNNISKTLESEIKPELKKVGNELQGLKTSFAIVEDRVATLWKDEYAPAGSPRQLNDRGRSVLEGSGIDILVKKNKEKLVELIREKDIANAYDAENAVFLVMEDFLKHFPEAIDELKDGAFRVGADLDGVLFVGAIYLRDLVFPDLGFSVHEIDERKK